MSDLHFDARWLAMRFAYDEAARNGEVETACLAQIGNRARVCVVDVGAGLGANCVHLGPRIRGDQEWVLLDHDERLAAAAMKWLAERFAAMGYEVQQMPPRAVFADADHRLEVQYEVGSVEALASLVASRQVHLVAANALLDLFCWEQCDALAGIVTDFRLPLLATVNYAGMAFRPSHASDLLVVGLYEQHMRRPQPGGARLGKRAVSVVEEMLERRGYQTLRKPSVWEVRAGEQAMQQALLWFMERALSEMELMPGMVDQWRAWLHLRRAQLAEGELHIAVRHFDLWAVPG